MLASITSFASTATAPRAWCDPSDTYRWLTGREAATADIASADDFNRHVFACILAVAASEGELADRCGLEAGGLAQMATRYFDRRLPAPVSQQVLVDYSDPDEVAIVRDLLAAYRSTDGLVGHWLCHLIARRALEPNHLWEDLGLRNRSELTRLMATHFQPLFVRNTQNMRWKRFIYRLMCADDGFAMCSTPVCSNCSDYVLCFGIEGGVSRLGVAPDA